MQSSTIWKSIFIFLTFSFIVFTWYIDQVTFGILQTELPDPNPIPIFETHYLYFYLHLFTFVPVFLLSFDKKVAFYKSWKYLFPAIFLVGSFFIFWDVIFTAKGVWGFNDTYITGLKLFHLPIEEWLFFVTVPFACVFIYECLIAYFPKDKLKQISDGITIGLIILFISVAIFNWGRVYTFSASFLSAQLLIYHQIFIKKPYLSRFYSAFFVSLFPFLLLNGVLTGGFTNAPVVLYNPDEFLGIRCLSVPLDDFIYCFVYLLSVVTIYESFKDKIGVRN